MIWTVNISLWVSLHESLDHLLIMTISTLLLVAAAFEHHFVANPHESWLRCASRSPTIDNRWSSYSLRNPLGRSVSSHRLVRCVHSAGLDGRVTVTFFLYNASQRLSVRVVWSYHVCGIHEIACHLNCHQMRRATILQRVCIVQRYCVDIGVLGGLGSRRRVAVQISAFRRFSGGFRILPSGSSPSIYTLRFPN